MINIKFLEDSCLSLSNLSIVTAFECANTHSNSHAAHMLSHAYTYAFTSIIELFFDVGVSKLRNYMYMHICCGFRYATSLKLGQIQSYLLNPLEVQSLQAAREQKSFLFTVVRNPWQRLLSTYIEKFLYTRDYIPFCNVNNKSAEFEK